MSHVEIAQIYYIILALLSLCIVVFIVILVISCKKKPAKAEETLSSSPSPAKTKPCATTYSLMDIDAATDGFNSRRIIGKGRLGTVYAAVMPGGELVAVKRIHPRLVLTKAGFGFSSSVKSLSVADHPNIVPIIGFSEGPGERIMVMEYEGMLSLEFYLHHNHDGAALLDWSRRVRIAAGAARGIQYLHTAMVPPIVHGCVKLSNILIDGRFCAKLCDYGLQFLAPMAACNDGDVEFNGAACKESDVYGLGIVVLELLTGKKSDDQGKMVKWALPLMKGMKWDEVLDHRLVVPLDLKPIGRLAKVAIACVANSRLNRPSVSHIVNILNSVEEEMCV